MKYTKYLLIALAATSCCPLSGMDWILHPFETRDGREDREARTSRKNLQKALKKLQKWENAMCEALKKEDAAAINILKKDLWPLDAYAYTLNDRDWYPADGFRSNKESLINACRLAPFRAATLAINQGCNVSVTLNFLYGSERNPLNYSPEEFALHDLLSAIRKKDSCVTLKLVKIIVELNLKQLDDNVTVAPDRKGSLITLAYIYRFCCESTINRAEKNYGANHEITEYLRCLQRKLAWDSGH